MRGNFADFLASWSTLVARCKWTIFLACWESINSSSYSSKSIKIYSKSWIQLTCSTRVRSDFTDFFAWWSWSTVMTAYERTIFLTGWKFKNCLVTNISKLIKVCHKFLFSTYMFHKCARQFCKLFHMMSLIHNYEWRQGSNFSGKLELYKIW